MVQDKEDYSVTNSEIIILSLKYFELQVQKIISVPKILKKKITLLYFSIFSMKFILVFRYDAPFLKKNVYLQYFCVMKTFQDYFVLPGVFRVS